SGEADTLPTAAKPTRNTAVTNQCTGATPVSATPPMRVAGMPYSPLDPPVTDCQLCANCWMISPIASVSTRKNTPCDRTATQPAPAAATAPAPTPTSRLTGVWPVACAATQPAAYAPTPK